MSTFTFKGKPDAIKKYVFIVTAKKACMEYK